MGDLRGCHIANMASDEVEFFEAKVGAEDSLLARKRVQDDDRMRNPDDGF